jgi:monofunctional glycosyltransferase
LNVAEWGEGIFGIGVAAHRYYGKPASELGPMEAAKLVTVLPNPRRLSPTGTSSYVENRAERIYQIMVLRGIVIEEFEDVMSEPQVETKTEAPEGLETPEKKEKPEAAGKTETKETPPAVKTEESPKPKDKK